MEVFIHTNALVVSGNTYKNREFLKSKGFKWNPNHNVWFHPDINMRHVFTKYIQFTDVRRLYFMKKTYEDRKIAALKVCEYLPADITKKIFKHIQFAKCNCSGKSVCWDCQYACCEKSTPTWCVCRRAFTCPNHGRRCNGSHD